MPWFARRPRIEDLVAEHYASVYRFAYRLCGSTSEAEDLTQETFCQAQVKIDQLRESSSARGWLFTIVRNLFLHRLRSRAIAKVVPLDESTEPTDDRDDIPLTIDSKTLQDALDGLDESFRTPLLLYFFEEFSYRQIADQLQIPVGTVMSRLARAKGYLRERLLRAEPELVWGTGARKEEA